MYGMALIVYFISLQYLSHHHPSKFQIHTQFESRLIYRGYTLLSFDSNKSVPSFQWDILRLMASVSRTIILSLSLSPLLGARAIIPAFIYTHTLIYSALSSGKVYSLWVIGIDGINKVGIPVLRSHHLF